MDTRTQLLDALRTASGWTSGNELSRALGISRNAVHKHMRALSAAGYGIEAAPRRGYRLNGATDALDSRSLRPLLHTEAIGRNAYSYFESLTSTNDAARALALDNAPHGCVVCADTQTGGRGRKGRHWASPPGVGLYVSVLLRPRLTPDAMPLTSLLAAVAAAEAVASVTGADVRIKWPNDLLLNARKIGGILIEAVSELDAIEFLIVGLGLNVNSPSDSLPTRPLFPASSLLSETGCSWPRAPLLAAWLERLEYHLASLTAGDTQVLLRAWTERSATNGRDVRVDTGESVIYGQAIGIDSSGALLVKCHGGRTERIFSGDIA